MKRVLCIINSMNTGGAETFLMKIYRQIDRCMYQMDFCINTKEECYYNQEIRNYGGRIFFVAPKSTGIVEYRKQLKKLIVDEKYEYVLRITSNAAGFMDLKIAKKAGAQLCAARSSSSSDGDDFKALLAHRVGRLLYNKYIDVKIAPSDLAAEYTFGKKTLEAGNVSILHNAVDLKKYRFYEEERGRLRAEYRIENRKVIGHIGRFVQAKNHAFLLDAFCEIKKMDTDAILLLVGGNGDLETDVRNKVKELKLEESVIFLGVRSDIPELLSAMDVLMLPSFYEGMPNVVIEAQATGLPCVIADTITKEADITGLVEYLPLENAEEWAKKVLDSIKEQRVDTKAAFLEKRYDIQSVADEFIRMIFGGKV